MPYRAITVIPPEYWKRVYRVAAGNLIGHWPLWEASGSTAEDISGNSPAGERDGTHVGVTLGQPGIGDGRTSPFYDGANDYTDIYSAAFAAAFNGDEGTVMAWARAANAGVWTDGANRGIITLQADANNLVRIRRRGGGDFEIQYSYIAGGVIEQTLYVTGGPIDWFQVGSTWSISTGATGEVRTYFNGFPVGATDVGLGAWAGNLAAATTVIGAQSTAPLNVFHGYEAHVAVWDRALSPAEMLHLGVL